MHKLGTMPLPSGPYVDPLNPYGLVPIPKFHIKSWVDEMEPHNKEKEDQVAMSLGSSQYTEDHSLPPAQKCISQEDEVFMEEA